MIFLVMLSRLSWGCDAGWWSFWAWAFQASSASRPSPFCNPRGTEGGITSAEPHIFTHFLGYFLCCTNPQEIPPPAHTCIHWFIHFLACPQTSLYTPLGDLDGSDLPPHSERERQREQVFPAPVSRSQHRRRHGYGEGSPGALYLGRPGA